MMELQRKLERMIQVGTVTDVRPAEGLARVKHADTGMISDWLYVLQHGGAALSVAPDGLHTHGISDSYTGGGSAENAGQHSHPGSRLGAWMPPVGSTVLVLYAQAEDGDGDGYILGGTDYG